MRRQADLLEVVGALRPAGGFAGRLHGGKEEADERPDDRDDDKELDEREGPAGPMQRGSDADHGGLLKKWGSGMERS